MLSKIFFLSFLIWLPGLYAAPESLEESTADFETSGNDQLLMLSRKDNADSSIPPTNQLLHEMKILAQYGNYSAAVDWTNQMAFASSNLRNKPFVLEKATALANWGNWEAKAGDTHEEFGRGIALSLYRDDVFGVDDTVQGAQLRYHTPDAEALVFGGRVHSLTTAVALNPLASLVLSRDVWLVGASGSLKVDKASKLSSHYLLAMNQPFQLGTVDTVWHTVGATFTREEILEGMDFYGEGNILLGTSINNGVSQSLPTGFGNYGALTYTAKPWKLKWEVKDYRNDNFDFRRPPTLEEEIVETLNIVNVTGSRLGVEREVESLGTTFFTSYLLADDRQLMGTVNHAVGGVRLKLNQQDQVELKGGYRWVPGIQNIAHLQLKTKFKTSKGQFVELEGLKEYSNLTLNLVPAKEDRNTLHLTYTFSESVNATVGVEYLPTNDPSIGQTFVNLSGTFKMGSLIAKGLVGQTSGGPLCSGGICRIIPPFTGAMVETQYAF